MEKLLNIVLKAASGQNSSDCVRRTFLTLLGFGWAQGDGNVSFVWASKIFAWTPMSSLLAGAVSIFVAVSLFQRASLSLTG